MHKGEMPEKVQNLVQFRYLDATQACFPENYFDVVYSRDAIMHIADKEPLYEKVLVGLLLDEKSWYNEPRYSEFCNRVNKNQLPFWEFTNHNTFDIVNIRNSEQKGSDVLECTR